MFENKVLRKIFGAQRGEMTGEWRKLHNVELHVLYSSPNVIKNLKSRRLRQAGHVERIENLWERDLWARRDANVRINLKGILRRWVVMLETGMTFLKIRTNGELK